jgi:hypothetical protein
MKRYIAKCYLMALLIMAFVPGAAFADPQLRVEVAILLKHGLPQPSDTSEKPPFSGKQSGEIVVRMELIYSLTLILRNAGTEDLTLVTGGFLPRFSGRRLTYTYVTMKFGDLYVKESPYRLGFVTLKPGEITSLPTIDICESSLPVDRRIHIEYGVDDPGGFYPKCWHGDLNAEYDFTSRRVSDERIEMPGTDLITPRSKN